MYTVLSNVCSTSLLSWNSHNNEVVQQREGNEFFLHGTCTLQVQIYFLQLTVSIVSANRTGKGFLQLVDLYVSLLCHH